jgi:hypothetical protein
VVLVFYFTTTGTDDGEINDVPPEEEGAGGKSCPVLEKSSA